MTISARTYVATVGAAVVIAGACLAAFGWISGPAGGDLVRIGGLDARAFRSTGSHVGYTYDLFRTRPLAELGNGSAKPPDVLIFGDSFSIPRPNGVSWINTFVEATGFETVFSRYKNLQQVVAYLSSRQFAEHTPRMVIVETAQRATWQRLNSIAPRSGSCPASPGVPSSQLVVRVREPVAPIDFRTATHFNNIAELMSRGAVVVRKRVFGAPQVLRLPLVSNELFSSKVADQLLVLSRDVQNFRLKALKGQPVEIVDRGVRCGLGHLLSMIAAAGATPLFVIAPDKLQIYEKYLMQPSAKRAVDVFSLSIAAAPSFVVNLEKPLSAAVAAGEKDIYWPDDTHWSARGHHIVGNAVAGFLLSSGIASRAP